MKKLFGMLIPVIELVLSPFILLASLLMYFIRKKDVARFRLSKKIFNLVGVFPVIDHFYEPLFNPKHLRKSLREDRPLPGVDLNIPGQLDLLDKFRFADELKQLPLEKTGKLEFYYHNGSFETGDACFLYNIVRFFKPKRIIEIGSGNSTLMALSALKKNREEDRSYSCEHICIEPFVNVWNTWLEQVDVKIAREKVENADKELFRSLQANDVLFIDSSHIIRPQGDVLFEFQEVLPLLASGVIVHVHDIFTPKDYRESYIVEHVQMLNEQYLLEAFLAFNSDFKVIGALNYLKNNHFEKFAEKCPVLRDEPYREPGSFWIMRK